MLHLWVIALFVAMVIRDSSMRAPLLQGRLTDLQAAALTLGSLFLVGAVTHLVCARCTRLLRAKGSWRAVIVAETTLAASRWAAAAIHIAGVIAFGWLDVVRRAVGDLVVVDELLTLAPTLLVFTWGWWALWPLERSLRDAALLRRIDEGNTLYPMPSRGRFAFLNLRQQVLVGLVPLALILAWNESIAFLFAYLARHPGSLIVLLNDDYRDSLQVGADLLGVAIVFLALGPLAMRFVWDTVRLAPGPLRDRLSALCRRYRVRVSEILVWRTHGTMINGAVLGLTPAFRYVLLTDALLDSLPDEQVEAVMAHEVAHVRHRHIIWLGVVTLVCISIFAMVAGILLQRVHLMTAGGRAPEGIALTVGLASFAFAMLIFGVVSRRFEWQADAFAAAHMSRALDLYDSSAVPARDVVTHDGAAAMAGALRSVARLNHVPLERRSWRHGSIGYRIRRLGELVGTPVAAAPIQFTARLIKYAAILALLALLVVAAWQVVQGA